MKKIKEIVLVTIFLLFSNISARFSIYVKNNTDDPIQVVSRRMGCDITNAGYPHPLNTSICYQMTLAKQAQTGDELKGPARVIQSGPYWINVRWKGIWYYAKAWQASEGGIFEFPGQFKKVW